MGKRQFKGTFFVEIDADEAVLKGERTENDGACTLEEVKNYLGEAVVISYDHAFVEAHGNTIGLQAVELDLRELQEISA